jgi:uncharacterized protein YgbK (DUF1537 family)
MILGAIADDFTGASDLANTLNKGGMATVQFVGVPTDAAPAGCEAGVVALKTRSVPAEEAVAESLQAFAWLKAQGCRQFLFKYCSTFDSTPKGNIGPVAEALLEATGAPFAVVCPAFPETGRTIFMGHLFVKDRLLSESGMEHHPLNPMTDPDLRRWLRRQTMGDIGWVPHAAVNESADAVRARLFAEATAGRRLIVCDAISEADLMTLGEAVADNALVTGGSGIALGLPENFRRQGLLSEGTGAYRPLHGPGVVLSGSCSIASRAQLARYLHRHPGFAIDPAALIAGTMTTDDAAAFVEAHRDEQPVVYSTAEPGVVARHQSTYGREKVAGAIEAFFATLARRLVEAGFVRIAIGGGETAGAIVTALPSRELIIGPEIDPGVPALAIEGKLRLRLALKSGNFGAEDFYEKALAALGAR